MTDDFSSHSETLFEIVTPLGFSVRTIAEYWQFIVTINHPILFNRLTDVQNTLSHPDEIRLSKTDAQVYLFYRDDGKRRWVCAVARRLNGEGFLITAYRTSAIKEGDSVWQK
ncbi:envelope fusion protein [Synechococcus sp. PCC 6716]|nr:envelope fusion protein [Synechococcus sp. PCC 6716]